MFFPPQSPSGNMDGPLKHTLLLVRGYFDLLGN